jgi:hypothetical protein
MRLDQPKKINPKDSEEKKAKDAGKKAKIIRFKGIKKPKIHILKTIRLTGTIDITQEQWRREFGTVLTYENLKRIVLHTKRFVNPDGSTRPFLSFDEFNTYYKTK